MAENYLNALNRRNFFTWIWAFFAALLINAGLFIIMPMLQSYESASLPCFELIPDVELVPMHSKESIRREPAAEKEKPERIAETVRPAIEKSIQIVSSPLELPFRVDPGFQPAMEGIGGLPKDFGFSVVLQPEGIFSADELDAHIGVQVRVHPVYPIRARERRIEGWVKVQLLVDESGLVERAEVVEAHPPGYFEKSVLRCVKKWKLTPPTVDGSPVKTWMLTKIKFRLE
jgi:protein TonB